MFSIPVSSNITIIEGHYHYPIVLLSIIIACAASYTALILNQRVRVNQFFNKYFWLLLSAIAMGLGIWSMHFIGMSAFMLPIPMKYDVLLTVISILPAVFTSYIAFYIANKAERSHMASFITGVVMGLGIVAMHYLGMAAMKMEAKYYYKPWLFIASITIAIVVSYVAIYIFSTLKNGNMLIQITVAALMGLAIASMHYVGMLSIVFYTESSMQIQLHDMHLMDITLPIVIVTTGIICLFIFAGLTSWLGRYADYRLTYFDALTRFPNQRQFEKDMQSIKMASSVAVIHLEHLEKSISAYGYSFGDKIISAIKAPIKSIKNSSINIYRIEGNRFAVISLKEQDTESLKKSINKVLSQLKNPLIIEEHPITINSVCAFAHSKEKVCVEELFSNCIAVLLHPSIKYDNNIVEFNSNVHTFNFEQKIFEEIDEALEKDHLFLVYQPKVCFTSNEVVGLEALLRWNHPTYGSISPSIFIPILEEKGKIYDVTDWVIEKVCGQIANFLEQGIAFSHVSINVPGSYVTSNRLFNVLKDNLDKFFLESRYLELEITETSVIHHFENAITAVNKFKEIGVSVALDDFGTGLSSLSYLKKMPISTIKIDKSFVDGVPDSERDSQLFIAIVKLCYSLNLNVVIEGVETVEQVNFIKSLDFENEPHIQGYYFSRPLTVNDLIVWTQGRE